MFLDLGYHRPFSAPWDISYEVRLSQLAAGKRRIAYFYEVPDTSTFRYRVLNPALSIHYLNDPDISASWFTLADLCQDAGFIDYTDVMVFCRCKYGPEIASLIAAARARGVRILFDCDDLVFDPDRMHLVLDSLNVANSDDAMWGVMYSYSARLNVVFKKSDGFITTNSYLGDRARELRDNMDIYVMPNYLNGEQQRLSNEMYYKKRNWKRDDFIHLGYFSGSPTHAKDFAVALPAIRRAMASDRRIKLRIVGFHEFADALSEFSDRVELVPLQDYNNLQRFVGEVEINLAPLHENQFTNCKSELKFFEAAACGTLTLASPTHAFKTSIDHGRTGFLVPACGWDAAIRQAIALVDDRESYQIIADAAFEFVERTYGHDKFGERLAHMFLTSKPSVERGSSGTTAFHPS